MQSFFGGVFGFWGGVFENWDGVFGTWDGVLVYLAFGIHGVFGWNNSDPCLGDTRL